MTESDREFKICASEKLFVVRNSLKSYSFRTHSEGGGGGGGGGAGEPESERKRITYMCCREAEGKPTMLLCKKFYHPKN